VFRGPKPQLGSGLMPAIRQSTCFELRPQTSMVVRDAKRGCKGLIQNLRELGVARCRWALGKGEVSWALRKLSDRPAADFGKPMHGALALLFLARLVGIIRHFARPLRQLWPAHGGHHSIECSTTTISISNAHPVNGCLACGDAGPGARSTDGLGP